MGLRTSSRLRGCQGLGSVVPAYGSGPPLLPGPLPDAPVGQGSGKGTQSDTRLTPGKSGPPSFLQDSLWGSPACVPSARRRWRAGTPGGDSCGADKASAPRLLRPHQHAFRLHFKSIVFSLWLYLTTNTAQRRSPNRQRAPGDIGSWAPHPPAEPLTCWESWGAENIQGRLGREHGLLHGALSTGMKRPLRL